ncbi:helix-turn-helix domain-containing protein [Paenibacillus sp. UMB4589-SE434]|uniref:helix-turn-helix domain-containing protein n=1 Tax=Paenibacillus sp. UMB4589-SE434 TaxID=3046314 RepID=UPI002549C56B|nr:helix-turn-helix domain-containing protein [Paenibacillus sp. UMB4589-SE434]MDK8181448.1 helix-turn-helix domain-containing protein [Paenibacillus sp. UMB4589-SE434]
MPQIMVACAEGSLRAQVSEMIEGQGYEAWLDASSREEALRILEQDLPRIVLADMMLPAGGGLRLLQDIEQSQLPVAAILLSPVCSYDYVHQALQSGAVDYLVYPFEPRELAQALRRAEKRCGILEGNHRLVLYMMQLFNDMHAIKPHELLERQEELLRHIFRSKHNYGGVREMYIRMLHMKWMHKLEPYELWSETGETQMELLKLKLSKDEDAARYYFQQIAEHWLEQSAKLHGPNRRLLMKMACLYINENYKQEFTLTQISERYGMSVSYFSKQFKHYSGDTLVNYVNKIRIQKAKRLLMHPQLKIYEVAHEVGYSTLQYFNRVFKQFEKATPLEYRRKIGL